jgi:starch-binding outer membrane protein, SusD/RagB family
MIQHHSVRRATWSVVVAGLLCALPLSACNLRHELVAPQTPGVIDDAALAGPTGANGLRLGALAELKRQTAAGETLWQLGGLLADEWKSSSGSAATNEIDQRSISTSNASVTAAYNGIQQARGYFNDALNGMTTYRPDYKNQIGELYLGLAFIELQMAEDLCNGIPFGTVVDNRPVYGIPKSGADILTIAAAHIDAAIALTDPGTPGKTTDTADVNTGTRVRPAAFVARGRLLVDLGKFSDAATAVASVTTAYQYSLTFSTQSGLNGNWNLNTNQTVYTLGDSTDASGVLTNALPFASAKDSRVPSANPNKRGADGNTSLITQSIWTNTGQIQLLSGVDARLIEAEARLSANDFAGMTTILNALRTSTPTMGTFKPAALPALTAPTTQAAAVQLFFREKAFWTFGRGQRLGDLRRMVRQYSLPASSVFPTGAFFKGGTYGNDVNLPVPDAERANPLFKGCLDRGA